MQARLSRIKPNLLVNKHVDGVPYVSMVQDLSLSGISLKTPIEPEHRIDATVLIEIMLEGAIKPMWLSAQLVRQGLHGLLVYTFDEMRLPVRRALERFVDGHYCRSEISRCALNG
jgi:hypothetical protein